MNVTADDVVLLLHAAATLFMFGLIWVVQLVHYPLMDCVSAERFAAFEKEHQRRISYLVGPAMLIEGATAIALFWFRPPTVPSSLVIAGLALIAVNVVSTAALQVPCHTRLARGFDRETHRRLVTTNTIRTAAWSVRAALVLAMLLVA